MYDSNKQKLFIEKNEENSSDYPWTALVPMETIEITTLKLDALTNIKNQRSQQIKLIR